MPAKRYKTEDDLTEDEKKKIRSTSGYSLRAMASAFGCTKDTVAAIRANLPKPQPMLRADESLTDEAVQFIREYWSYFTRHELAVIFSRSETTIGNIINHRTYPDLKHLSTDRLARYNAMVETLMRGRRE